MKPIQCVQPFLLMLLFFACSCNNRIVQPNPKQDIPFSDFIKATAEAKYSDFKDRKGVLVQDEAAFEEMKKHILYMYEGVTVTHSFLGNDGQFVDCIPINQQPGLKADSMRGKAIQMQPPGISLPQKTSSDSGKSPGNFQSIDITLKVGVKDKFSNEMYCPQGFIPMRRLTLEEMTHFKTLNDFFRKGESQQKGELTPGGENHYYAHAYQNVNNAGGDSWLNVWNPSANTHEMTLSQQWYVGGSGNNLQTIEGGWQVYPDKYSTSNACLFIYSTKGNYQPNTGCYNLDCPNFIQVANNIYLGSPFDHYSSTNGGQWGFELQWKRNTDGNWWLFYKGPGDYIAVGYYPHSWFGSGQLSNFATKADYGGEDTGEPTACEMGSGAQASEGWAKAAFQHTIFYINKDNIDTGVWTSLTKAEPQPGCYTLDLHNTGGGEWGTYFYFGGKSCN